MRNNIKENILELIQTLYEAHSNVEALIKEKDNQSVYALLEDCQDAAIHIGESIEQSEGENFITVKYLEAYCELLYTTSVNISNGIYEKIKEDLDAQLRIIEDSVRDDIKGKWEIVFLPYKVSMWDSLESVWKRAFEDDAFDTYVVPIPYYDRNPDRTFGECHYEGKMFPAEVPITRYEDYNFAERMPDAIFIHNPYDLGNLVTSVEPKFYSNILKNYTNLLIYIPYFLFPKEPQTHLIDTFALENVDCIFVQNEEVKEAYVNQAKIVGNEKVLEKVFAVGSPNIDKICEICKDGIPVPDSWKEMAVNKKKVFMNTNVSLILNNKDKFIDNLRRIFGIFKRRGDAFVIWREHPLTEATLKSMKPEIRDAYYEIRSDFVRDGLGVIDTNSEAYEAIYFSDCYFGSGGSLAPIYAVTGKPILITAYKYPDNISSQRATIEMLLKQTERSMFFSERYENFLDLFLDNIDLLTSYKEKRFEFLAKIVDSIDGTTGNKIMLQVKDMLNKERRG